MARWLILALILSGCGRVGYDRVDQSGISTDANVAPDGQAGDAALPDGSVPDASTSGVDYCKALPALAAPPTIDGIPDPGIVWETFPRQGWTGVAPIPPHSSRLAIAWRPDGIYFVVDVEDSTRQPAKASEQVYCGDGVEMYADNDGFFKAPPDYDRPGTVEAIVAAPTNDFTSSTRGALYWYPWANKPWFGGQFVAKPHAGGYTVEAFVRASDLGLFSWKLAPGMHVGIDASVHLVLTSGYRQSGCVEYNGQYFMATTSSPDTCSGAPFCDVRAFCRPILE